MAKIIYLLEVDQDVRDIMQYILEDSGYEVQLTSSETIALNIQTVKPDLILLDDWAIKIDPKFCNRLKKEPVIAEVPIILTTTQSNPEPLAEKLMADDVLPKPFELEDLVAKVAYWLKKMNESKP